MSDEIRKMLFPHPARVLVRASEVDLLSVAKKRAFDPKVFEESAPIFWAAEITNNRLDAYFTRMAESSLKNYAEDAANGVSFQNSHSCSDLGMGYSLTGAYEPGDVARVVADFYTIPGLPDTDTFIRKMRAGLARDVSIGFYGGDFICSLCNVDMFDWDAGCRHWPGDDVEIKDPQSGEVQRKETVFAWVVNAHLAEVSAVYDGATPGAAILRAQQLAEAGILKPESARLLEHRYRHLNLRLPDARHSYALNPQKEERQMADEPKEPITIRISTGLLTTEEVERSVKANMEARAALDESDISKGKDAPEAIRALHTEITRLRAIETDVASIRSDADAGKQYRKDLINGAVKEGIRAFGDRFDEVKRREMLGKLDLDTIKEMSENWRAIGDEKFKGGRASADEPTEPAQVRISLVPDAAFAS